MVEGQCLQACTAACNKRDCVSLKFWDMSKQCRITGRKSDDVSKKGHCLFLRRKMRQRELTKFLALKYGKRSSPFHFNLYMTKFQPVFAGRTKCSGGLHAARGPLFAHPWCRSTVCNLRPSIKVRAAAHIQIKIRDIAADAGVYQRKTEEMQKHICRQDV